MKRPESKYSRSRQSSRGEWGQPSNALSALLVFIALALVIAACGCSLIGLSYQASSNRMIVLNHLPTLTSTPLPSLTPTPASSPVVVVDAPGPTATPPEPPPEAAVALAALPSSTPTAAVMPTSVPPSPTAAETLTPPPTETPSLPPTPTPTQTPALPTATATPAFESAGWSFASVQNYPDEYGEGVILYGDVINNTGATQELTAITGTFYDPQGQLVADEGDVFDYWPINIVPAGGRVPFELAVYDVQSVANFNLDVGAQPSSQSLRQDFEFLELNQWSEVDSFCLAGKVKNTGDQLQSHLVILAILYNAQNNVVNFGDFYAPDVENLMGDQTLTFEVCSDPRFQEVANYDLRAWGQ